jgi:hypothetical protein
MCGEDGGDVMGNLQAGLPGAADQLLERRFQPGRPGILRLRGSALLEDIDPRLDAFRQGQGIVDTVEVPAGGGQGYQNFFAKHGALFRSPFGCGISINQYTCQSMEIL